jgi:putative endonuclease
MSTLAKDLLGRRGEDAAAQYLAARDYQILERNWRHRRAEVDLIVISPDRQTLIFVEVKTRATDFYGYPELAVTARKMELLYEAADVYQEEFGWTRDVRFDILALTVHGAGFKVYHIEHAFKGY